VLYFHILLIHYAVSFECFSFFFFQAEDGIRVRNVTGVQTCALPIYFCLCLLIVAATKRINASLVSSAGCKVNPGRPVNARLALFLDSARLSGLISSKNNNMTPTI